jgi:DNA-binding response OmpR family regulator
LDGFETYQTSSALECIEKLNELKDEDTLAVVVSGKIAADRSAELIIKAKMTNQKIRLLVVADKSLSEEKVRIMDYGADDFALKPLSVESIVNKVNSLLLAEAIATK